MKDVSVKPKKIFRNEMKISSSKTEDCAKDGGEEFFTEMHCVRIKHL